MAKLNFEQQLLQSSMSHDPSEIIDINLQIYFIININNSCLFNVFCGNRTTNSLMKRNVIALINLNKLYTSEVMNYFKLIMDFSVLISKTCKHFVLLVQQIICFSRYKSVCDKNIHIN